MKQSRGTTLTLDRSNAKIAQVTFANPPVNLITPDFVVQLLDIVKELEADERVQVLVLKSDNDSYYLNHFDLTQAAGFAASAAPGERSVWTDLVIRLSKAPFISIASVRGRTRGGGNELALAFDLRYASREKAFFGQPEVGTGILPGGGGSERLPRQIGRDRALEVILSSADYDAELAEKWGWVTCALPDHELDSFVHDMAARLASFDRTALSAAKAQIGRATLPPDSDLDAAFTEFVASLSFPGFNPCSVKFGKLLTDIGLHDIEKRLGHYLIDLSAVSGSVSGLDYYVGAFKDQSALAAQLGYAEQSATMKSMGQEAQRLRDRLSKAADTVRANARTEA